MTSTNDLIERIQKYDGVEKFLILNKNGNKLNTEIKDDEKHKNLQGYSNNFSEIPRLVEKAKSVVRNIDPLNELSFMQISYSNYSYLIAPDGDLTTFTAINTFSKK